MTCHWEDYDGPSVFHEGERKARTLHSCHCCGHTVTVGETYWVTTGLWDGQWSRYSTCERCMDLIQSFKDLGYCYVYGGDFWEWYGEELSERGFVPRVLGEDGDPISCWEYARYIRDKHLNWVHGSNV